MGRRRKYKSRKPSLQTKSYIAINQEQWDWVEAMWMNEQFMKYLLNENKLYYYQVRKAYKDMKYSDAPASKRALVNACKEYKKWKE